MTVQLKGPKIQRDIALLIRLLWRLEGWEDPTDRSAMHATARFVEHVGGFEPCPCSSCNSMISSSKTTAAILQPHIEAVIGGSQKSLTLDGEGNPTILEAAAIEAAVYNMLGKYLYTVDEEQPTLETDE